jgi:hypothetical protein
MKTTAIKAGNCYATTTGQVRYVISIDDDKVTYSSRGRQWREGWEKTGGKVTVELTTFAEDVDRKVACHIDLM